MIVYWVELTQSNVDDAYNIPPNRLAIAWIHGGLTICRMIQDVALTLSIMAKLGGYYYMEFPEIKL